MLKVSVWKICCIAFLVNIIQTTKPKLDMIISNDMTEQKNENERRKMRWSVAVYGESSGRKGRDR